MITLNLYQKRYWRVSPVTFFVPERWEDLTRKQFIRLAGLMMNGGEITNMHLLCIMSGIRPHQIHNLSTSILEHMLLPLCRWIGTDSTITRNLIPVLKIRAGLKQRYYYGPDDNIRNLKLVEYDFSERMLHMWELTGDVSFLYRFLACLYRPARKNYNRKKNVDGDVREEFNANLVEYNSIMIKKSVPVATAYAVVIWYRGCRKWMTEIHPRIFSAPAEESEVESSPGYFSLMRRIAEKGTYGDFDKVIQMYLFNALEEMECALDDAEAIKQEMQKIKNNAL